jgi:GTP cyclohydrolase I
MSGNEEWMKAEEAVRTLIRFAGDDPEREGLEKTPSRVLKAYREMFAGYGKCPSELLTTFDSEKYSQMIILRDVDFTSFCEHHLLPFAGVAHVAYIPDRKVIGASKLARLVEMYARRLQIQERMTCQVADKLEQLLTPIGTGCVVEATHQCMACRGVKKSRTRMVTSHLTGAFLDDASVKLEFLGLAGVRSL